MLRRRAFLFLATTAAAAAAAAFVAPALVLRARAAEPSDAASFVKHVGDALVAIVNGPGSEQDKRPKLQKVVNSFVDVDEIARFCLGRYWRVATPEQQKQYIALFHEVLLNNIAGKIGQYQGVSFDLGRTQKREDEDVVSSVVRRPNNPPTNVDWVISNESGGPKIIDVIAEGTSLRLTQRSDYASYLAHNNNNVQALLEAMRQQLAQKSSG